MFTEKNQRYWMQTHWRPLMAIMYMIVCVADFIIFPVLWSILQSTSDGQVTSQWNPITLQGGGLFHVALGAILGVAVFGRTKEKLAGVDINKSTNESTHEEL